MLLFIIITTFSADELINKANTWWQPVLFAIILIISFIFLIYKPFKNNKL